MFFLNYLRDQVNNDRDVPDFYTVSLSELFDTEDQLHFAVLSNYLWKSEWFCDTLLPYLAPSDGGGLLISGPNDEQAFRICNRLNHSVGTSSSSSPLWQHEIPTNLQQPYGCHHSKFIFLYYHSFVRMVILTNNFIFRDQHRKSGGLWVFDFPRKLSSTSSPTTLSSTSSLSSSSSVNPPANSHPILSFPPPRSNPINDALPHVTSRFEYDLLQYVHVLHDGQVNVNQWVDYLSRYDYSSSPVILIPSAPGSYPLPKSYSSLSIVRPSSPTYGMLRVHEAISMDSNTPGNGYTNGYFIGQYSSQGSLTDEKINNFIRCFAGQSIPHPKDFPGSNVFSRTVLPPPLPSLKIVRPTIEFVRRSYEGWSGGYSCPGTTKEMNNAVTSRLHRYQGVNTVRQRAVPHIKTFLWYGPPTNPTNVTLPINGSASSSASSSSTTNTSLSSSSSTMLSSSNLSSSSGSISTTRPSEEDQWDIKHCYVGSHNVSGAAWGIIHGDGKNRSYYIKILHYELGVLIMPSLIGKSAILQQQYIRENRLRYHPRFSLPSHYANENVTFTLHPAFTVNVNEEELEKDEDSKGTTTLSTDTFRSSGTNALSSTNSSSTLIDLTGDDNGDNERMRDPRTTKKGKYSEPPDEPDVIEPPNSSSSLPPTGSNHIRILLPLPYRIPPVRYSSTDQPWVDNDATFPGTDCYGATIRTASTDVHGPAPPVRPDPGPLQG